MAKHTWKIMPITILGKWSIWLIAAMLLFFILGTSFTNSLYKTVPAGDTIFADIAARPALALTMLGGMISGILAFLTGLLALVRQKEKAILVYVSSFVGGLVLVFLIGEVLSPH